MKIKHHVQKTFETTDAYAGIDSVEKRLIDNSFLVVMNEGSFIGILTPSDVIESPYKLVIDCLHEKPRIDCNQDIESILKVMKESRNFVLPVFDGDVFIGIVLQAAITAFLLEYHNELARVISERTAELSIANEQLRGEIEENKLSKEKIQESKKSCRTLAENIPGIVYRVFIKENNRMQFFNDMLKPMTGYRVGELIKGEVCSIEPMIIPEDRQDVIATVKKAVMENKIFEVEYRLKCKNGDIGYFIERGKPIYGREGPLYIDGVILDITERQKAEKELKKLIDELEQRVEARTSELLKSTQELQSGQEELLGHKLEMEKVNKELLDTNIAVSVLAKNINKNREEAEKKIALTINSDIMPIIANLKDYKTHKNHRSELDVLSAHLNDITTSLSNGTDIIVRLSPSEMRVAAMIKNGLTGKEIATKLNISLDTVKTHRKNIRKKLKIHNSDINLANYLRYKWSKG